VQVERRALTEAEIVAYARELRPAAERVAAENPGDHPSFFEFMTAMAFLQFARKQCEMSVIEVGLGGRLDATNVVIPEVSVITSIGLDHCEFLGNELAQIAAEKAGIIKAGRPVVIGRIPAVAEVVIRGIAAERGARVTSVAADFGDELERYPHTNLEGDYQRWNAATATLVARALPENGESQTRRLRRDWRTWTGQGAGSACELAAGLPCSMRRTIPRGRGCSTQI